MSYKIDYILGQIALLKHRICCISQSGGNPEILQSEDIIEGDPAPEGILYGYDPSTGDAFYVDTNGDWQAVPSGGGSPQDLQSVTDQGFITSNLLISSGGSNQAVAASSSDQGSGASLRYTAGEGSVTVFNNFISATLKSTNLTDNRDYQFPDTSGTLALQEQYIPLAGTASGGGGPVTGDIEFDNTDFINKRIYRGGAEIYFNNDDIFYGFKFDDGSNNVNELKIESNNASLQSTNGTVSSSIAAFPDYVSVNADPSSQGLVGQSYFPSKDPNTYAQMQDLINGYIPLAGTSVGNPVIGTIKLASGIIHFQNEDDPDTSFLLDNNYGILKSNLVYLGSDDVGTKKGIIIDQDDQIMIYDPIEKNGLQGDEYFGDNASDNSYIQKKYVDQLASAYKAVTDLNYDILVTDSVLSIDNGASSSTPTLPDPIITPVGKRFIIKRYDSTSVGTVTIDVDGGANVQDSSDGSWVLSVQLGAWGAEGQSYVLVNNGTAYETIL